MRLLVAGDYCPQCRVVEKYESGDYSSVLGVVKEIIADVDYSILNFECPVTDGEGKPISKCGPNLQCSERGMEAVKWAGFHCVTLANNHFLDYGEEGVKYTLRVCEKNGIDFVGGGINIKDASRTLYINIKGKRLAIINCCEHEFSIATAITAGSNPLNPIQQYYAIKEAKSMADYVVVIVHGGNEYYQLPSPRMKETYRFFIETGADAVVNHHQHCFSGYELYNNKPIFYGLGNFCFDNPQALDSSWNNGYMVVLHLDTDISFEVVPYCQCDTKPIVRLLTTDEEMHFKVNIQDINDVISNDELLFKSYESYLTNSESLIRVLLSPYKAKWMKGLCRRHLLPSFLSNYKKKDLLGYLQCESHLPKILHFLKNSIEPAITGTNVKIT